MNYALAVIVNGRKAIVGKVFEYKGTRVLYRTLDPQRGILHKTDALSIDVRAAQYLLKDKVAELHVAIGATLYTKPLPAFILESYIEDNGDGAQLYLPRVAWTKRRNYKAPYIPPVITI